jgi:hypothetical protein
MRRASKKREYEGVKEVVMGGKGTDESVCDVM